MLASLSNVLELFADRQHVVDRRGGSVAIPVVAVAILFEQWRVWKRRTC